MVLFNIVIQKKAYFLFGINLNTQTKEHYRNRRTLKICATMHWTVTIEMAVIDN